MPRSRSKKSEVSPTHVAIVSNNPETLDELSGYLGRAGVPSHGTRAIEDIARVAPDTATAAVIFPDDFADAVVASLVAALRLERPRLLIVLVTRAPNRLRSILAGGRPPAPLVLPRPSFGWDILDAIRSHSHSPRV